MPEAVEKEYERVESVLKDVLKNDQKAAKKILSAYLNLLTAYPDQPYGHKPIYHPIGGHLRALFQRQDVPLVFQQDDGLLRRALGHFVVGVEGEGLALQGGDGLGDGEDHVQDFVGPHRGLRLMFRPGPSWSPAPTCLRTPWGPSDRVMLTIPSRSTGREVWAGNQPWRFLKPLMVRNSRPMKAAARTTSMPMASFCHPGIPGFRFSGA